MIIRTGYPMEKPRGADGRHKAGHDGGGRFINKYRYQRHGCSSIWGDAGADRGRLSR